MIETSMSDAYEGIDARAQEVFHAYASGFIPKNHASRIPAGTLRTDPSANKLEVTAPPSTLFVIDDQYGRRFYTRNGDFRFNNGTLTTQNGSTVLGAPANAQQGVIGALREDPVDVALHRCSDEHVEADGTVAYTRKVVDPKSGMTKTERVVVGRLVLSRFPAGTELIAADGVHVTAPTGTQPAMGLPMEGGFGALMTQTADRGGYNIKAGLTELREAYDNVDGLRAAMTAEGKLDKSAMDLLK